MSENGFEATPKTSGGSNKLLIIIGGLLIFGIIAAAAVGLFLAFTLGWIGGGSDIIVGFPDSDYNYDLYLVEMGTPEDEGVRLAKDAEVGDYVIYVYQKDDISKMIWGAGFVPGSQYLFLSYTDDGEAVFEQMQTNADGPSDLFSSEEYPVVVAFPEQKNVIIVEYMDDEARCYLASFGEEAERVAKGTDCIILPDGESLIVVEEDDGEYTFTALNTATGDESRLLVLEGMLDLYMISHDGSLLAYVEDQGDEKELHLIDIAKEDDETLATGFNIPDFSFAMASNDFYYMVEDEEGMLSLFVNDDNDAVAEGMLLAAQFGPVGDYLIYSVGDEMDDLVISSYSVRDDETVEIMDGDGLEFAVIQDPGQVIITESKDGDVTFFASTLDGDDVNELMDMSDVSYFDVWSVAGHDFVYFVVYTIDGANAFAYPIGGEGFFFVEEWAQVDLMNVSPNGKYLAFGAIEDDGDNPILYYVELVDGSDPVELDDDAEWIDNAVFTRNSQELLYTVETGSDYNEVNVNLVSLEDAKPETLYDEAYLVDVEWGLLEPFDYASFAYMQEGESYCPGATTLSLNSPVDATIGESEVLCFRFSASSGDILNVDVDSTGSDQDLTADLVDRDGNFIISNDDGLWDYDPWLAWQFTESGVYYVEISDLSGVAGDFTIELTRSDDNFASAQEIFLDDFYSGTITFDSPIFLDSPEFTDGPIGGLAGVMYEIYLYSGENASFSVTNSDGREIYLVLIDGDHYLTSEADSNVNYGESWLTINPDVSGTYYLLLYAFDDYEPTSLAIDFEMSTSSEAVTEGYYGYINFDEIVSGSLSSGVFDQWEFYGYSGDTVLITMESSDFDTYLYLLDPYGTQVAYNDDSGGTRNSQIEYTLTTSGYYVIQASSYGTSGSGDYALSLELTSPEEEAGGYNYAGYIEYGDTVESYLYEGYEDGWEFYGSTGDTINVSLVSEDFDCVLELLDSNGAQVAYDDDSGGSLDSLISAYTLQSSGYFTIIARGLGSSGSGYYELQLWTSESAATGQEGTLEIGDTMSAELAEGANDHWDFWATEGEFVTIFLGSEDFDTYLEILDDTGYQLAYNDDGGGNGDSFIWGFAIPETGYYTIVARGFNNSGSGDYFLFLGETNFASSGNLDYGDYVNNSLESTERIIYSFDASSGDSVTISLESDDFDTYLELRDEDGIVLITNDDGGDGSDSLISDFNITASGTYLIVVRAYSATAEGDFYLSLTED